MKPTIFISGLHSGPNPSPGIGIARSLRISHDYNLVGVDYSPYSSGIHYDDFDDVVIFPSWSECNINVWVQQIRELLRLESSRYVSSLDAEARLIAHHFDNDEKFLSPPQRAMRFASKPPVRAAHALGLRAPEFVDGRSSREQIRKFIDGSALGVWVKGQHYEAFRAYSIRTAMTIAEDIDSLWGPPWHIERHLEGQEISIAFAARSGVLIDAVLMRKATVTDSGKAWTGTVEPLPIGLLDSLKFWVEDTDWTGGGELEIIEDWHQNLTLLEVNPRFPAWIHGATVCGANLPGALIAGVQVRTESVSPGFTRIVEEIPLIPKLGVPTYPWSVDSSNRASTKHPSGMPQISRRGLLREQESFDISSRPANRSHTSSDEEPYIFPNLQEVSTPFSFLDREAFRRRLAQLQALLRTDEVTIAYSVKTNPDPTLMRIADGSGCMMEIISQHELRATLNLPVKPSRVICNGPAKSSPDVLQLNGTVVFADSSQELLSLTAPNNEQFVPQVLGIRVSSTDSSRFGILAGSAEYMEALERLSCFCHERQIGWGVHFHLAQSSVGTSGWRMHARRAISSFELASEVMKSPPSIIDFGGGWDPGVAYDEFADNIRECVAACRTWLPYNSDTRFIVEPGKMLLQKVGYLFTTVIGRRNRDLDVVVDAGIPDAPETQHWDHPAYVLTGEYYVPLRAGKGRILGRTCMENDILLQNVDTRGLAEGSVIVITDTGAYDSSMAYSFARG